MATATEPKIVISAVDKTAQAFASATRNLSDLGTRVASVRNVLGALGVSLSAGAFTAFTRGIINGIDALNDVRDATGATIENISALEDIAARTGTSFETVSTALVKFNGVLKDAKPGTDAAAAIKALGLNVRELQDLDPAEALRRTAVALAGFADDGQKARLVQELFGKSLREVAPLLNDLAKAGALNAKVTTEQAQQAEKFNNQMASLAKNSQDAARALLSDFLPAMNRILTVFSQLSKEGLVWNVFKDAAKGVVGFNELTSNPGADINQLMGKRSAAQAQLAAQQALRERTNYRGPDKVSDNLNREIMRLDDLLQVSRIRQTAAINPGGSDYSDAVSRRFGRGKPSLPTVNAAASKASQQEAEKELALLNKLSGVDSDYQEQLQRLFAVKAKGVITEAQYVKLVEELISKQPIVREENERQARSIQVQMERTEEFRKELEEAAKERESQAQAGRLSVSEYARGIDEQNKLTEYELTLTGQTVQARRILLEQYRIELDLQKQLAAIRDNGGFNEADRVRESARARAAAAAASTNVYRQARLDDIDEATRLSEEAAKSLHEDTKNALSNAFRDTSGRPLKAFGDALYNVIFTRMTNGLADAAATYLVAKLLGGGSDIPVASIVRGGSAPVMVLPGMESFAGGGYTGNGSRSGGLDGKGGFLSMLHPRETVVDHTRGQSNGFAPQTNITVSGGLNKAEMQVAMQQAIDANNRAWAAHLKQLGVIE